MGALHQSLSTEGPTGSGALGGSSREPVETGSGSAVTYHCAPLAAHIPSCQAASQSLVSQKAWLSGQYREGGQWGRTEGAVPRDTETDPEPFPRQVLPSAGEEPASPALLERSTKTPNRPGQEGQRLPQTPSSCSSQTEAQRGDRDGLRSHSMLRAEAGLELSLPGSPRAAASALWCPTFSHLAQMLSKKPPEPLLPCQRWLTATSQPRLGHLHDNARGPGD